MLITLIEIVAALPQGSSYRSNQFLSPWQTSTQDENASSRGLQDSTIVQQNDPQSGEMDLKQHGSVLENKKLPADPIQPHTDQSFLNVSQGMSMQNSENIPVHNQGPEKKQKLDHDPELGKLQNINNQQPSITELGTQHSVAMGVNNQQVPSNQPALSTGSTNQQASNINRGKQVPFALLLPVIQPQLDKDRAMQLNTLYLKLRVGVLIPTNYQFFVV